MATIATIAEEASQRLGRIAERAIVLARGVGLLSTAAGGFAYLIGFLVFPGAWRIGWIVVGLILCSIPAIAVWTAARRMKRVIRTVPETANELRNALNDKAIRNALLELVERDEEHEAKAPLIQMGKDLFALRGAVTSRRDQLLTVWRTVTAITSLPGLIALGTVGSFGLLIFSAVAVVVRLVLLKA